MIDRQAARRRQLQWRMRAAVLLALVLLAALTLLDELSTPDEAMLDSPQFTQPVAVRKVAAKAVEPLERLAPLVDNVPVRTVVAAQASGAAIETVRPAADSLPASPALPAPPGAAAAPAVEQVLVEPSRAASGHLLQSGVLPDRRQAEELQAQFLQEGIPARVETRLQIGPFKTAAEAEAARRKLKVLGVDGLIVAGEGRRP